MARDWNTLDPVSKEQRKSLASGPPRKYNSPPGEPIEDETLLLIPTGTFCEVFSLLKIQVEQLH